MTTYSPAGVLSFPSPVLKGDNSDILLGEKNEQRSWQLAMERQSSIIDDLLFEIYDRWHDGRHDSFESDTFTEYSSTSEAFHWRRNSSIQLADTNSGKFTRSNLETQTISQLRKVVQELQHQVSLTNSRLVRELKRRERRHNKLQHNSDLVTAILQASSQKRRIDTRLRFNLEPPPGDSAFEQWKDAMKAVARLPLGIPDGFRKKVWLSLAENHIRELRIDWDKTVRFVFNERSNPDDNTLGTQIVKDLHRTGCSGFSGQDNEEDRAVLKRVLLAYARWNKNVGYCQGFNMIAALLLDVMDRKEDDALMVMIYLIDHVLPDSYFANNLRALSVDMAVFRDLLALLFPKLAKHLDYLQYASQDQATGANYEPPLTNVFTMQWFLTLFSTCLPKDIVLRVWDAILLEGSEILLRIALAIWGKLSKRILSVGSADEFYSLMGVLTQDMMEGKIFDADTLIKFIYSFAPFPMPQLPELREKYTYNIRPFTNSASGKKASVLRGMVLPSDEDEIDEEDLEAITCFTGIIPGQTAPVRAKGDGESLNPVADISSLGPGAYGVGTDNFSSNSMVYMERMTTDINLLKKQYSRLKQRQNQAHIILAAASAKQQAAKTKIIAPKIETPTAMNHLFVGKPPSSGTGKKPSGLTASGYPHATLVHHYLQGVKKHKSPNHRPKTDPKTADVEKKAESKSSDQDINERHGILKVSNLKKGNGDFSLNVVNKKSEVIPDLGGDSNNNNNGDEDDSDGSRPCDTTDENDADSNMESAAEEILHDKKDDENMEERENSNDSAIEGTDGDNTEITTAILSQDMQNNMSVQKIRYHKKSVSFSESEDVYVPYDASCSSEDEGHRHCQTKMKASTDACSNKEEKEVKVHSSSVSSCESESNNMDSGLVLSEEVSNLEIGSLGKKDRSDTLESMSSDLSNSPSRSSECSLSPNVFSPSSESSKSFSFKRSLSESISPIGRDPSLSHQTIHEHLGHYKNSKSALLATNGSPKGEKSYCPFPVKHFNENRAKTGVKLGIYKADMFNHLNKQQTPKRKILWSK